MLGFSVENNKTGNDFSTCFYSFKYRMLLQVIFQLANLILTNIFWLSLATWTGGNGNKKTLKIWIIY